MKKIAFISVALLSFVTSQAQFEFNPGIKAGVNIARFTDANSRDEPLVSYHIGATFGLKLARFYTLQPELTYSKQGNKYEVGTFTNSNDSNFGNNRNLEDFEVDYLSLTLANKFYVYRGINLQLAPFLDILVSKDDENFNYIEPIDIGLTLGLGYDFPIGAFIDARFKQGFIPITDTFENSNSDLDKLNLNQVIQFSVGYQF